MKNRMVLAALLLLSFQILNARTEITVIGVGRLGICTALCFEKAGYDVLGVDVNSHYIHQLNEKTFNSFEPNVTEMLQASTRFKATSSLDEGIQFADLLFIMVDTPTTPDNAAYDHRNLNTVLREINKRKVANKHIVIGCTVFPDYIQTVGRSLIADCTNTTLSYNPEFIAQGNIIQGFLNPDIVLIGQGSQQAGDLLEQMYKNVCENKPKICRMSPESAQITKLALNCFITTKISYANMVGDIADQTEGADKYDILEAVGGDERVGRLYLKPGYGFGGPCFPRDNRALGSYANHVGIKPHIPQATDSANKLHTQQMIQNFLKLGKYEYRFEKVTYKENCSVPIIEESQKLVIAQALVRHGKKVIIADTPAVIQEVQKEYGDIFEYEVMQS